MLVIDRDEEIFRVVRELLGGLCPVIYAPDTDAAVAVMQTREIGVVVTDVEAGHGQLTDMLKLLKRENPQILTIVATSASSSELVIELINEAQIFRFVTRPGHRQTAEGPRAGGGMQRYLTQAVTHTRRSAARPAMRQAPSSIGQRMLDGIKALRGRWFGSSNPS